MSHRWDDSDEEDLVVIATAVTTAIVSVLSVITGDGRSFRQPSKRRHTCGVSSWGYVEGTDQYHEGWYRDQFRCKRKTFDVVCDLVQKHWHLCNKPMKHNNKFLIRDRVAVTLHYLTHSESLCEGAKHFGMSLSTASRSVWEVVNVVNACMTVDFWST